MKKHISILVAIVTLIFSCKEKEPTAPKEQENSGVLAESVIGPSGGTLETEDFSLAVPTGSFSNDVKISLSTNNEYFVTDENSASETFIISGIPSEFTGNLRIAIKYNGTLSGTSFIALASTSAESFLTDSLYAFNYLSTIDSAGFLVANLSSTTINNSLLNILKAHNKVPETRVEIMTKIIPSLQKYSYGYVETYFPANMAVLAKKFTERADYILNIFINDFGFDFKYDNSLEDNNVKYKVDEEDIYKNWKWPVRYFIVENFSQALSALSDKIFDENKLNYTIYNLKLLEPQERKTSFTLAFNWMNLLEHTFNKNQDNSKMNLLNGLKLWFETYLYPDSYENPPSFLYGSELNLFNGFKDKEIHYGLATLLKYLTKYEKFTVNKFGHIFEEAHSKDKNHYVTFLSQVDDFIINWFPDYYEKYMKGEIYNINSSAFLNLYGWYTWSINSPTDNSKTFTYEYNDLSAKRFFIELNHEFEDESATLTLEASTESNSEGTAMLVFGLDANGNLQHLRTGRAEQIEIQNLKGFYQNGTKKFLVVVVNCINNGVDYTGSTNIYLTAKIKSDSENVNIEGDYMCYINHLANYDLLSEKTGSDGSYESKTFTSQEMGFAEDLYGKIENYSFHGDYQDSIKSMTVDISFNNSYDKIESISVTLTYENNISYYSYSCDSIKAVNISIDEWGAYKIRGSSYCNSLTMADHKSTDTWQEGGITYTRITTTTGVSCNDKSYIDVLLFKQSW